MNEVDADHVQVTEYKGRKFDRVHIPRQKADQRRYMIADLPELAEEKLSIEEQAIIDRGWRNWTPGPILDQGAEGACTGFGAAAYINAGPTRCRPFLDNVDAYHLYRIGQRHDEFPGEDYDGGTTNGAALALRALGRITAFRWAYDIATVIRAWLLKGPIMFGLDWTEDMMRPDANGYIRATGAVVGGHALLGLKVNEKIEFKIAGTSRRFRGRATLQQSWGIRHGKRGLVHIPLEDLSKLLGGIEYPGEACIADEVCVNTTPIRSTSSGMISKADVATRGVSEFDA